ncbi:hypothetical protein [Williamsia sp. CHRR-6]|uniref:hypothetical protein n=1 Tax=Williamsia sp. CHRR-6 TaxID=2835871 RepID=UPI001BD97F29|nr:hypothetical protein [Williamsia sp. CHRR-6]MBT0568156.1 hypothetical protein [Williamsia sp. CHRR-6]
MSVFVSLVLIASDLAIVGGWIWSLTRGWTAADDPDFELAIEAARQLGVDPDGVPTGESAAKMREDAVAWKHRLENRASLPAFGSAVLSGTAMGFSGNAYGHGVGLTDTWIISFLALIVSLIIAFASRLMVAKRIQRRLPRLFGHLPS